MKSIGSSPIALALFIWLLAAPLTAQAGIFEIGASGSYRRSNIDIDAYDESSSITGSISYYLNDASALELSYTDGTSRRVIAPTSTNGHKTTLYYQTAGLDFVYTFGTRESAFRPYLKIGGQYILQKRLVDQYLNSVSGNWDPTIIQDDPALVPSGGFGFRIGLTESLSLKCGVDAWSSRPLNMTPVTLDYAGRAGLSWMF